MTAGDRLKKWIDDFAVEIKDRLRDWMAGWLAWGLELILDTVGRGMGKRLDTIIDAFGAEYDIPADTLKAIKEAWKGEGEWQAILGGAAGGTAVGSLIGSTIGPWLKLLEYQGLKIAKPFRLDPASIITAWRRDKPRYEKLFEDLEDQGWNPDRLDIIKELAKTFPPLPDMVRFADYGSFDPEIIEEWREMYDAPGFITEPFETIGITNEPPWEWASKYWFSHWTQPGRFELNDMFRRGLLSGKAYPAGRTMTPAEIEEGRRILKITYLTQGYSSYWQDKLADTVKEIPTRVDVRRFWDMRTIDEDRLREIYQARGYFDQDLEDYVLWTKVYVAFPDLLARWSKGWITIDDVRSELVNLGMPAERVEEMIQTKITPQVPEDVQQALDLTKTEVYKGINLEKLTREQGIDIIMRLGKNRATAEFLVDLNTAVLAGSPETFEEYNDLATKYLRAVGKEVAPMPEELKQAAAEVVKLTGDIEALTRSIEEEQRGLVAEEVLPEETTKKLKSLQVKRNRAESKLSAAKLEYDRLVAEWRHEG